MVDPVAFWSYARHDDEASDGWLSALRLALAVEMKSQTGDRFTIQQDRDDILWGQTWRARITESIDGSSFLIPLVSPSFLKSDICREEVEAFLDRQSHLGRDDLVLPIYYITCPQLHDETLADPDDAVINVLKNAQRTDWRQLRFSGIKTKAAKTLIAKMAEDLVSAMARTDRNATVSTPTHSSGADPRPSADTDPDDEDDAGLLDHFADIEVYLEALTETITHIGETLSELGRSVQEFSATNDISSTGGAKRVTLLAKLGKLIEPHVDSLEEDATSYTDLLQRVDSAVLGVLGHVESLAEMDGDDKAAFAGFVDNLVSLDLEASGGLGALDELGSQVAYLGRLSKVIRPTTRRMARSLDDVRSSRDTIAAWASRGTEVVDSL